MNNNPIGIFDSGIGGLSIAREIANLLPDESILYFADSRNCPYGGKSRDELLKLSKNALQYLVEHQSKLIVIACNTVTVSCIDDLRREFPETPIIGIVPVIKRAAEVSKNKKIGVLSTSTTSKSEYQADLIQKYASDCEVISVGTDDLVPLIEKGDMHSQEFTNALEKATDPFKNGTIDALALGCSHFPLVRDRIQNIVGNKVQILDSGGAVARHVSRILSHEQIVSGDGQNNYEYVTSGSLESFQNAVREIMRNRSGTIRSL